MDVRSVNISDVIIARFLGLIPFRVFLVIVLLVLDVDILFSFDILLTYNIVSRKKRVKDRRRS